MQGQNNSRIPVTIITGFLGAGKTTLLNRLIRDYPHKRIAIIENEFGEQGIDNELVIRGQESLFAMSAGCICCDLNTELIETLRGIAELPPRPDHLVIETTGIADPGGIIRAFLQDFLIQQSFCLDGVICVADGRHLDLQLQRDPEAVRQIASANCIVLNKIESCAEDEIDRLSQVLSQINGDAAIYPASFGQFDAPLLELCGWDMLRSGQRWSKIAEHHHHHHHIVSHSFVLDRDLDLAQFDLWMRQLLQFQGENIYRTKGIVAIAGVSRKLVFQSVQGDYVAEFTEEWQTQTRQSRLVFLGRDLRRDILAKRLQSCQI